ncbi:uncharacterized protein B0H18DRAFT_959701 [Fomitopsis serialis]|uniref:uncharacterized protein n=1 Tax=Fomitopsis serialis TaxID=139415 RepID=UPI002008AF3B|nr:uncharacterized protein B0H18DRAFT_959701 [Neoantrodia serialis]KAH9914674.1 hypothetical protein B0H18DRAFT_959701 [Neoantrodia serialis]
MPPRTRATNTFQHPGQVVLDLEAADKQPRRTAAQMAAFRKQQAEEKRNEEVATTSTLKVLAQHQDAMLRRDNLEQHASSSIPQPASAPAQVSATNPGSQAVPKPKPKRKKPGRAEVEAFCHGASEPVAEPSTSESLPVKTGNKRKSDVSSAEVSEPPPDAKRVKPANPSGLLSTWPAQPKTPARPASRASRKNQQATASSKPATKENVLPRREQKMASIFELTAASSISPLDDGADSSEELNTPEKAGYADSDADEQDSEKAGGPAARTSLGSAAHSNRAVEQRNTSKGIVSVNREKPDEAAKKAASQVAKQNKACDERKPVKRITNEDLPCSPKDWISLFVPTLFEHLGRLDNPWATQDANDMVYLQKCWNDIFPTIKHVVTNSSPAGRKCHDWRTSIGKNAVAAVQKHWGDSIMPAADRAKYVERLLHRGESDPMGTALFLWRDWRHQTDGTITKRHGRFQSRPILETLAYHLQATDAAIYGSVHYPCGALLIGTYSILTVQPECISTVANGKAASGRSCDFLVANRPAGLVSNKPAECISNQFKRSGRCIPRAPMFCLNRGAI